jgi:hypothetical protein
MLRSVMIITCFVLLPVTHVMAGQPYKCNLDVAFSFIEDQPTLETHSNGGFVSYDGKLYLWGGLSGSSNTARLEVFDPSTQTWMDGAFMPEALRGMGEFELSGFLYSVGGEMNPSGSFSNKILRYDPGADTWQQLANFPTIIWDPQSAVWVMSHNRCK